MPSDEEIQNLAARVGALEVRMQTIEKKKESEPIKPGPEPEPDTESKEAKQTLKEAPKKKKKDDADE